MSGGSKDRAKDQPIFIIQPEPSVPAMMAAARSSGPP
jgi:hypothetical protein